MKPNTEKFFAVNGVSIPGGPYHPPNHNVICNDGMTLLSIRPRTLAACKTFCETFIASFAFAMYNLYNKILKQTPWNDLAPLIDK